MENQCRVKYIFQCFESRTVLQPVLAKGLRETGMSPAQPRGSVERSGCLDCCTFFSLGEMPREVTQAMPSPICGVRLQL